MNFVFIPESAGREHPDPESNANAPTASAREKHQGTWAEDPNFQESLSRIIHCLVHDTGLHKDLMQDLLVHVWQVELKRSSEKRTWYLQNCRFRLLDILGEGRSVDSLKRRDRCCALPEADSAESTDDLIDEIGCEETTRSTTAARELLALLLPRLGAREQKVLLDLNDDLGVNEIAEKRGLSRQKVTRVRLKIRSVVIQLGIPQITCSIRHKSRKNGNLHH
jgi:DNA-directed RNA polymerase specialized sigma24 family protein